MKILLALALLGVPSLAQVQLGKNVQVGGSSGCTVTGLPANSVLRTDGATCLGSSRFTWDGTNVVDINSGAKLLVEGVHDSGANTNETFLTGDSVSVNQDGADIGSGIAFQAFVQDNHQTVPVQLLLYDAQSEVTKAGNSSTGFQSEPAVSGAIASGDIFGFVASNSSRSGGATIPNVYGFQASTFGTQATTEEFSFNAETAVNVSIHANYCDFMARTQEVSPTIRASIGCGPTMASTFGGPVAMPTGSTVNGSAICTTATGCGGGGGSGISGLTPGFLPLAGSATTLTTNSHIDEVTNPGSETISQPVIINDGSGIAGSIGITAGTAPTAAPTSTIQINAPSAVTAYAINLPGAQPTAGNPLLSCTAANPAVCSWAAASGGSITLASVGAGASPTGLFDFSSATHLKVPIHAGYTAPAVGEIGYDSTNGNLHTNYVGTDLIIAGFPSASLPVSGNCAKFTLIGAWWELDDAGAPCGSGGGTGFPIILGSTSIAAGSTTAAVTGLSVNGVTLNGAGSSSLFLNQAGGYTTPAVGSNPLYLNWTFNSGSAATDASPRFLASHTATIATCYALTTASDGATALTFNIFDNGSTIFSGGAQTIAAGTAAGTLTTLGSLGTTSITNNDKFSFNITSGTSSWIFTVTCK